MENSINHKVGIKILSDAQLENVLPTYENLLAKIEVCRKVASIESDELKRHYQYNFMYDNVFSILGQRGTGKTSVAFTLQQKIREKNSVKYGDVVLPIIIPEIIPENCTVLGWLLAIVGEEIEKLEEDIFDLQNTIGRRRGEYAWESKEFRKSNLVERLDRMNQLIHAGNYNPQNEKSYYLAVENSVIQAGDYYKFAKEIANLWDAWIKRKQEYLLLKEKKDVCPLIYFIFDDVDLAPEKIDEILSVIMKYLSHPNIIVLTTADEELFLEVIERRLDRNIGRLPAEWRRYLTENREIRFPWRFDENESIKSKDELSHKTARKYLGKVLPASSRYYLKLFNSAKQKQGFRVEDNIGLGEGVLEQIQILINGILSEEDSVDNFMDRNGEILSFYLKFMGNTSRQIGNVYIALKELVKVLIRAARRPRRKDSIITVFNSVSAFLHIAINSNHAISSAIEYVDDFVDDIFLLNYNQWKLYINYGYLNDFLENELKEKDKKKRIMIGLALFSLLAFVENILLVMERLLPEGITNRTKIHTVKFLSEFLRKEIYSIRYILRDDMPAKEFFAHYANLLDRLENIVEDELVNKKFNLEYFYGFRDYFYTNVTTKDIIDANKKDHIWFEELIGRLFLVYGNVYLIDKNDIKKCCVTWDNPYRVRYQMVVDKEIMKNMNNIFAATRMHREWDRRKKEYDDLFNISPIDIKNNEFTLLCNAVKNKISEKLIITETYIDGEEAEKSKKIKYVGLGNVLKIYMEVVSDKKISLLRFNEFIYETIQMIGTDGLNKSEKILRAINFFTTKLMHIESSFGKNAIISEPYIVREEIKEISDEISVFEYELDEILSGLQNYVLSDNEIIVDVSLYGRILNSLDEIEEWVDKVNYKNEEIDLKNKIRRILSHIDIAVGYNNTVEFRESIRIGDYICYLNILQEMYVYLLVRERYEIGNSFSSVELEKVSEEMGAKDTYYHKFFETACRILEKESTSNTSRDNKTIQSVIKKAYLRERQNYVKTLIAGEK